MTSYGPIITSETQETSLSVNHLRNLALSRKIQGKKSAGIIEKDKQDQEEYFEGSIGDDSEYEDDNE